MTALRCAPLPAGCRLTPGSASAVHRGCSCPPVENHFGKGYETAGAPTFLIRSNCPLHGEEPRHVLTDPVADVEAEPQPLGEPPRRPAMRETPAIGPTKRKSPTLTKPRVYKPKPCKRCTLEFTPSGPRDDICKRCRRVA